MLLLNQLINRGNMTKDNVETWLIVLVTFIIASPIAIVYGLYKLIKWIVLKVSMGGNNNSDYIKCKLNKLSKDELLTNAKYKYSHCSQSKKDFYVKKRRMKLKSVYIPLIVFSFIIGTMLIVEMFFSYNILFLMLGIIFITIAVLLTIIMFRYLQMDETQLAIKQIANDLIKVYKKLNLNRVLKYKDYVKQKSKMYEEIVALQTKFETYSNYCKEHFRCFECTSKHQFDVFNYDKNVKNIISEEENFFFLIQEKYEQAQNNLKRYNNEREKLKYSSIIETEKFSIDYETFHEVEKLLYEESIKTLISPKLTIKISYKSPAGRNSYFDSKTYEYPELLQLINSVRNQQTITTDKKRAVSIEKQIKKLEDERVKFEQEKQEFLEVTKGHIYSSENVAKHEVKKNIEPETLSQKLKQLRNLFDSGEIDYDEYQKRRKELM